MLETEADIVAAENSAQKRSWQTETCLFFLRVYNSLAAVNPGPHAAKLLELEFQ
jgi:hypothetical protein